MEHIKKVIDRKYPTLATPANMARLAREDDEPIAAKNLFSYCRNCGEESSASAGDYFMQPDNVAIKHCGEDMILVRHHRFIEEI